MCSGENQIFTISIGLKRLRPRSLGNYHCQIQKDSGKRQLDIMHALPHMEW